MGGSECNRQYLKVYNLESYNLEKTFQFEGIAYELSFEDNIDINDRKLIFSYSSLNVPKETYEYDLFGKECKLLKSRKILNFDKKDYDTKCVKIKSRDNVSIPVSILYKNSLNIN